MDARNAYIHTKPELQHVYTVQWRPVDYWTVTRLGCKIIKPRSHRTNRTKLSWNGQVRSESLSSQNGKW